MGVDMLAVALMNGTTQRKGNSSGFVAIYRTNFLSFALTMYPPTCKKGSNTMASTVFKSLTDTTFDSVEGYRKAAEKADSPQLQQALNERCQQREQTLQQMNAELQRQGDELVTEGTLAGEAHQMWQSITSAFESNDEAAAERVEEGEEYLRGKFESALESDQLEAQERAVVQQCYDDICRGERFGESLSRQVD